MNNLFLAIDKSSSVSISDGALYSILAIIMVFAILLIIIGITTLIFKLTGLFELKAELDKAKESKETATINTNNVQKQISEHVVIKDDDMLAAVLVASIDYQNQIKKDVKVVYVNEL